MTSVTYTPTAPKATQQLVHEASLTAGSDRPCAVYKQLALKAAAVLEMLCTEGLEMDVLTRSGARTVSEQAVLALLHHAAAYCFESGVFETVVQENTNPFVKFVRSTFIKKTAGLVSTHVRPV